MTIRSAIRNSVYALALLLLSHVSVSQVRLQVFLETPEGTYPGSVFIAGDFNGWNPGSPGGLLQYNGKEYTIIIDSLKPGPFQYKFTKGSWEDVEVMPDGSDRTNRVLELRSDTIIRLTVEAWKSAFSVRRKMSTAGKQVFALPDSLDMPGLGRFAKIHVYLPASYKHSRKQYPVIYMHDGQNLFDELRAPFGEWGIDETMDSLVRAGHPEAIIVGIDNGPRRVNEYTPFDTEEFGKGQGDAYVAFIANRLKPFIDKKYRTLRAPEHTAIAGSSLGGLISYYAWLSKPNVFGNAGVFSPSFWIAPRILPLTDSLAVTVTGKCFFYIGEQEGDRYVKDMYEVADRLGARTRAIMYSVVDPIGEHKEASWRKWFAEFYLWIMGNGFNRQLRTR